MSWLIGNATGIYLLLLVIAAGCVAAWRFNQRVKFLGFAGLALVAIGLFWLLTRFVTTDAKQLEDNVLAMARAVEAGNVDDLFKHISKDFNYKGMTRDDLYGKARAAIKAYRISEIRISQFRADVARAKKSATTSFMVSASADRDVLFRTEADFVLEAEQWKLKTLRFYKPLVDAKDEVNLPWPN